MTAARRRRSPPPSDTRGAAAVEFAMVLVPFLVIVLGLLQVGLTFGTMAALNEAATETARALPLAFPDARPTPEDVLAEARARFKGPDPSRVTAVLEDFDDGTAGQILRLGYDMPLVLPLIDWDVSRLRAAALVAP